jgi:hypothetical protein
LVRHRHLRQPRPTFKAWHGGAGKGEVLAVGKGCHLRECSPSCSRKQ